MGFGRLRHPALAVLATLVTGIVVSACGGGGGDDEGGAFLSDPQSYQPLADNGRWVYSDSTSNELTVTSVIGTEVAGAGTGAVIESVRTSGGVEREVLVPASDGLRHYAPAGADAMDRALDGILLLRSQVRAGDSWVQADRTIDSGYDLDGDGRQEAITVRADATAIGLESVTTPAGSFEACLHQRQKIHEDTKLSATGEVTQIDFTIDTWYAAGIGPVKTTTRAQSPGFDITNTQLLVAYRVGNRQSDAAAPTVLATSPGGSVSEATASVSAEFNKPMDPASFGPGTFRVFNSAHVEMPGSAQVEGSTVQFVPGSAWDSDTYTAVIGAGVRDLLGHQLGTELRWTFTVDTSGPGIVRTSPADGASEVAIDKPIVLEFSEPVATASVNTHTVWLYGNGQAVPFTLMVDGAKVTVTPTAPLAQGTTYRLSVYNVTDTLGNVMPTTFEMQFHSDQGLFAWPVPLVPNGNADTVAIGDVNGDGIPDVLMFGAADVMFPWGLVLRTGLPDGTLDGPDLLSTGDDFNCGIGSIEIGDVNGDGRNDVVVDEGTCGVRVLHQTASGLLEPAELLNTGETTHLRLADLDGDGRPELVGATSSGISIWKTDASGTLALKTTLPIGSLSARDLEVGDVNGDGRPDIVLTLFGAPGQDVAVLRQQADGSFATPALLSTGSLWNAIALAIGDFNGDGRQDLAVTIANNSPTTMAVFYQGTDGTLGPATQLTTYDVPMAARAADINGDGRMDLVVSHQGWNRVGIYLQQADGTLAAEQLLAAPYGTWNPRSLAVGDVTRDGRPDILLAGQLLVQKPAAAPSGMPSVLRGRLPLRAILACPAAPRPGAKHRPGCP